MSGPRKNTRGDKARQAPLVGHVLGIEETTWKFETDEERIKFEAWKTQLLNGVESKSTYIEKIRFLNKYGRFELEELGTAYATEFDDVFERVVSETIDHIWKEAEAKETASERVEYLDRVALLFWDFRHNHLDLDRLMKKIERETNQERDLQKSETQPPSIDPPASEYQRPRWKDVQKRADAFPTPEEQIEYLKQVQKEDRLYRTDVIFENLLAAADGLEPTFQEKLSIEISYREGILKNASRGSEREGTRKANPLRWLGTQEQLAYLIYQLKEAGLVKSGRHWKQAGHSFVDEEGNPYKSEQLKSIAGSLGFTNKGASSTRAEELEDKVSRVKNLGRKLD